VREQQERLRPGGARGGHPTEPEALARRTVELSSKIFGREHSITATAILEEASARRELRCKALTRELEKHAKTSLRSSSKAKPGWLHR
jgi:hypothetical protein